MLLTDLPEFVLEHIFSYLSYDEIAKNRVVCKQFNQIGWHLLNRGFHAAEKYQSASLKAVKLLLPRRESERRKHPLSKKCDILTAIETRLSMLSMAFSRYMETKLCCFIPGKVIDELFRVMRSLDDTFNACKEPQSPYQILQELRDVSTMAMEYFDDKIAPDLKKKEMVTLTSQRAFTVLDLSSSLASTSNHELNSHNFHLNPSSVMRCHSIEKIVKECCVQYRNGDTFYKIKNKKEVMEQKKILKLTKTVRAQGKLIKELTDTVNEQSVRLSNSEAVINDLKRQNDEWKHNLSKKFSGLIDIPSEGTEKRRLSTDNKSEEPIKKKRKVIFKGNFSSQSETNSHSVSNSISS